jgi:hypothetical protein
LSIYLFFLSLSLSFLFPGPYPPFSGEMVGFSSCFSLGQPSPSFFVVVRRIFFRSLLLWAAVIDLVIQFFPPTLSVSQH